MSGTVIYSSSICGHEMRQHTISLKNIMDALTQSDIKLVYIDKDPEAKKLVFSKTNIRGKFPLLFHNDEFIGTYEEVIDLSEAGLLAAQLK